MMFSVLESVAFNVREQDDILNTAAAGVVAGGIFKSTAVSFTPSPRDRIRPSNIAKHETQVTCDTTQLSYS